MFVSHSAAKTDDLIWTDSWGDLNSLLVSIAQFLISLTLCGKRRETFWPGITINALRCTPSTNKGSNMCMLRCEIIRSHRKFMNGFTARRHRMLERHLAQIDMRRLYSGSVLVGVGLVKEE